MDDYLADRRGAVSRGTLEADDGRSGISASSGEAPAVGRDAAIGGSVPPAEGGRGGGAQKRIDDGEAPLDDRSYVRKSDGATVKRKQPRKPLSPRSINTLIATLATLLDVAMERSDVEFTANAARGPRRNIRIQQPKFRSFLEVDQVWGLLDAATIREERARANRPDAYPARAILSTLTLGGLRIAELTAAERGLVNLGVGVIQTARSKTAAGYREVDIIFETLHVDLARHLGHASAFTGSHDLLIPSNAGNPITSSNIRQRVLDKTVLVANQLLRDRNVPEIRKCTPHTLRRTYISLLLAAGCDPAYVQQQVGHTHPTLTLRIDQQLLKRKRSGGVPRARQRALGDVSRGGPQAAARRARRASGTQSGTQ